MHCNLFCHTGIYWEMGLITVSCLIARSLLCDFLLSPVCFPEVSCLVSRISVWLGWPGRDGEPPRVWLHYS